MNKPSERTADHSEIDDDTDDNSVSSISNHPTPQATRITKRTKKDRRGTTAKTPQASTRTTAESEVWDIELESKLPSSARDVSSDPGANDSAVVLDLRGAQWSASVHAAEELRGKTQTRSLSVTRSNSRGHSVVRSSPLDRSDLLVDDGHGLPHAAEAPSLHPSHSASQVGRRPSNLQLVTSQYFTEPEPVSVQAFATNTPQTPRSGGGLEVLDFRMPDQDVQDAALDVQTIRGVASPINSLISVAQSIEFQTRYDIVPLGFPSDCSSYDDCYARVDMPLEPLGEALEFESSVVEVQGDRSIDISGEAYHHPHRDANWFWCPSADLADDVGHVVMEGSYHPLPPEYESAVDPGAGHVGEQCFCETGDFSVDGSICHSEEEDVSDFLEGRALLLGVPSGPGLSGLAQAEMDVASGLRNHWRPLRLS